MADIIEDPGAVDAAHGGDRPNIEQHADISTTRAEAMATGEITIFADLSAKSAERKLFTFDGLCNWLTAPKEYPDKARCPLLKLAAFGDRRTAKGSLRFDANALAVTGLEGDHDAGVVSVAQAAALLGAAGVQAVIYTSPSHTPALPRWRVLALLQ